MNSDKSSIKGLSMHRLISIVVCLLGFLALPKAQEAERVRPTWWFGGAAGANLNYYSGTLQELNSGLTSPAPFHKGFGTGLYLAPHLEYRHDSIWGGMLQAGYDNRSGTFDDIICPCGETATLSTTLSYFSIEPSLRVAPFAGRFYVYAGPRFAFNWAPNFTESSTDKEKTFEYTREGQSDVKAEFNKMSGAVFSGQIGFGYDIPLAAADNKTQVDLSPFISYQPYWGQQPRSVETWAVSTLRMGAVLKFGNGKAIAGDEPPCESGDVKFSARAPKAIAVKRRVKETFPLRNYVFFDTGSAEIPNRYVLLTKEQAAAFKEEQLQEVQPKNLNGRSLRQMTVYYNILNTVGDRMKRNPTSAIALSGASDQGPEQGKARAEAVKKYLVDVFGIDGMRIATEGRDKPRIPSEQPEGTKELALLKAGNSRVDIESASPEMMIQVGGGTQFILKPVQIVADVDDPLDSHVLFNAAGANEVLSSWSLEITDEQGEAKTYGPYLGEKQSISGNTILGDRPAGDYKVALVGQRKDGKAMRKEAHIHLIRRTEPVHEAVRFSILFDYGQAKSKGNYGKFITEAVVPLIPDSGTVIIHGYTDIIGEEDFNQKLSDERVEDTRGTMEGAIAASGKRGITFETFGFGENLKSAPFDNVYPEEHFYNRTVIIDIVPN
jgi:outer membrane protein OmpA-like peptidoglycan-associated protein